MVGTCVWLLLFTNISSILIDLHLRNRLIIDDINVYSQGFGMDSHKANTMLTPLHTRTMNVFIVNQLLNFPSAEIASIVQRNIPWCMINNIVSLLTTTALYFCLLLHNVDLHLPTAAGYFDTHESLKHSCSLHALWCMKSHYHQLQT